VTRDDLITAFGRESTILIAKDYKHMKLFFEAQSEETTQTAPQVYINGHLIRPVQLKMVNSQKTSEDDGEDGNPPLDSESLAMLNEAVTDIDTIKQLTIDRTGFNGSAILKSCNQLNLFKRGLRQKNLTEHDTTELKSLAENVLSFNKYQGKSKFQFVSDKDLILPDDYEKPGFISINPEADEYSENYSADSPSVHDLYDFDISPIPQDEEMEEDAIDEDEYIVEELDEEMLNMLQ
jgi:hypothetical protein